MDDDFIGRLDDFLGHLLVAREIVSRHCRRGAQGEYGAVDTLRAAVLEDLRSKGIRPEVITNVMREFDRAIESTERRINEEDAAARGDSPTPDPEPKPEPMKGSPKGKKKRRGGKGKGKHAAQRQAIPGGRSKGVGNRSLADFPGARHVTVLFGAGMASGCACPHCLQGKLERMPPALRLRFEAASPITAVVYNIAKLRCGACRQGFEAPMPPDTAADVTISKATPAAAAQSLLLRYGMGFPDSRLDELQAWHGMPFDNSRQWAIAARAFDDLAPVRGFLTRFVANASLRQVDDCSVRVIEDHMRIRFEVQNAEQAGFAERQVRTGLQTTVFVATNASGVTYRLFLIGRAHQGEREHEMASLRETEEPLTRVTDAASKADALKPFPEPNAHGFVPQRNTAKGRPGEKNVTQAYCLEHLRQTLEKATPGFAREMPYLMDRLVRMFELDAEARQRGLDAAQRLAWHQEHSRPLFNEMLAYATSQIAENPKAEPNGDYRRALNYLLGNAEGLGAFLRVAGVPLTTTDAEQGAKFTKKHHHNSLSFQTHRGAEVGAFFMSLVASCVGLGVNPLAYLTALLRWRAAITDENAGDWMPDTFERGVEAAQKAAPVDVKGYVMCPTRRRPVEPHSTPPRPFPGAPPRHQTSQPTTH
ncbi:MAG: transposase [Burkholderiales bacterium]